MNNRLLEIMYQQWQQGNDNYVYDWIRFVELASREFKKPEDEIIRELQKQRWFHWPNDRC
jgi:hypothetical protein